MHPGDKWQSLETSLVVTVVGRKCRDVSGVWWEDAANFLPYDIQNSLCSKEFSGSKCQWCWARETAASLTTTSVQNVWIMSFGLWKSHSANIYWTVFTLRFNHGIHPESPLTFSFSLPHLPLPMLPALHFPHCFPITIEAKNESILWKGVSGVKSMALSSY